MVHINKLNVFLACGLVVLGTQAHAFDTIPKYQTSVDQKSSTFTLGKLDSEYSSHLLNFSRPIDMVDSPNGLAMSIGSMSSKEFLIQQKVQMHRDLTDVVPFRFFWWQDGNREKDAEHFIWSLGYRVSEKLIINGIGNAYNNKGRNDFGFEAGYSLSDNSQITFVYLKPDFQKNERNVESDRWEVAPQMIFIGHEYTTTGFQFEWFLRHEPESESFFTDSTDTSAIAKNSLGGIWKGRTISAQLQYDIVNETENTQETDIQQLQSRIYYDFMYRGLPFRAGLGYFAWQFDRDDEEASFHDIVPNIAFTYGNWTYGYDVTFRNSWGDDTLSRYADENAVENRLVFRWNAVKKKNAEFALLFTIDLEEFGNDETWEGGGANLRVDF